MTLTTLGMDVGTTAVKVVALDPEGRTVAEASAEHDLISVGKHCRRPWQKAPGNETGRMRSEAADTV